jgi:hypothetical protein
MVARLLDAVAVLIADLASREALPFPRSVPVPEADAVARFWGDLFGGWEEEAPAPR